MSDSRSQWLPPTERPPISMAISKRPIITYNIVKPQIKATFDVH